MKKLLFALLILQAGISAQTPTMLKDLTPGIGSTSFSHLHVMSNQNVLFRAFTNAAATSGLYVSDGSSAGTIMLRQMSGPFAAINAGSKTFLTGTGSNSVFALWTTDGTAQGTDSVPLPGLTGASGLISSGNTVYFVGSPAGNKKELWQSDGTVAGTYSLISLDDVKTYSVVNNVLYFLGKNASSGTELYRSDGTGQGTYMLKDIWPGAGSSFSTNPIAGVYNNTLFLVANDGTSGAELWRTDGTTNGTSLVKDIFPGSGSSGILPYQLSIAQNGVYFPADNQTHGKELWFSDGTPMNTVLVKDLLPGTSGSNINTQNFTYANNNAYFIFQNTLYKTNGTAAGTSSLDVSKSYPGASTNWLWDNMLRLYNNELYYLNIHSETILSDVRDTLEFSKVDLNLTTRTIVSKVRHDKFNGTGDVYALHSFATKIVGSHFIYFYRTHSAHINVAIFNASTGARKLFYDRGPNTNYAFSGMADWQPVSNKFYFPFAPGMKPAFIDLPSDSIVSLGASTAAYACGTPGMEFWVHRGYVLNNKVYFLAGEAGYGIEWWSTDFTSGGTGRVKDIQPGNGNFHNDAPGTDCTTGNHFIQSTASNIFFGADDGSNGYELWSMLNTSNPLDLKSENASFTVKVYPNPASGGVLVEGDRTIEEVVVYNLTGALVEHIDADNTLVRVNTAPWKPGIYLLLVRTESGTEVTKFIKE